MNYGTEWCYIKIWNPGKDRQSKLKLFNVTFRRAVLNLTHRIFLQLNIYVAWMVGTIGIWVPVGISS